MKRISFRAGFLASALIWPAGCAAVGLPQPAPQCLGAEAQPAVLIRLFFGRDIQGRSEVSEEQWQRFLREELSARFPQGLSVIDAQGAYQDRRTLGLVGERAKIVLAVAGDPTAALRNAREAAAIYRQRFNQQSVGIVYDEVCASF